MKRFSGAGLVPLLLLAVLVVPAAAFPHGYHVEPAFGAAGTAASGVTPVTFWDLTLREMAIVLALALTPALVLPVEVFFALKMLSCFAFRKIARGNILASSVRKILFEAIRARPGMSFAELLALAGTSRGALSYHLALLRFTKKIVPVESHGIVRYFENSDRYGEGEREVLKYLQQDVDRRILLALLSRPGQSRQDLADQLNVSGPTVTWHMKRLSDDGLICHARDGRFSRYSLADGTCAYLEKYGDSILRLRVMTADIGGTISLPSPAVPAE